MPIVAGVCVHIIRRRESRTTVPSYRASKRGVCRYCSNELFSNMTLVQFPDGTLSHVACEIDARRQNRGH